MKKDATLDAVGKEVEALMKNYQLPPGYSWKLGKGFDQQDENSQTMMFNLLLAIAMIYLVMAAVFESTVYPMSIITSIFMAIVGVIWLLFVTRTTVTLMAFIGVQILIGVVVNIGIVLVAHINELRSTGMERMAAIVQAGRDRLRPDSHDHADGLPRTAATRSGRCIARRGWWRSVLRADGALDHGRAAGRRRDVAVRGAGVLRVDRQRRGTRQALHAPHARQSTRRGSSRNQRSRTLKRSQVSSASTLGSLAAVTPCEPCASTSPSETPQDSGIGTVSNSPR